MLEKGNGISCSKKNRQVLFTLHINICRGIFEPIIRLNIFLFHILRTFRIGKDRQKKKKEKRREKPWFITFLLTSWNFLLLIIMYACY